MVMDGVRWIHGGRNPENVCSSLNVRGVRENIMSMQVMVLDDSAVMRKIVMRALRASGINIGTPLEGASGDDGMTLIGAGHRPQLILSDVNMAGMDGITFVKHARQMLSSSDTKIVMISTESGHDRMREAMVAGADGFLTKPFTPEQIAECLTSLNLG